MSEWSAVQNPMIQYAEQIGWLRVSPDDANALRGGITEGFFADVLTVQLHYALAPSDLRVDRETLEKQFLGLTEAEGMTDQEELNAILERAVVLKEMMKAPTRVAKIAAFVAQHFRDTVAPMGFKAFLVAVDREACAFYKEALDRYLPPEMSRVVISAAHNDGDLLKRFYLDEATEKGVRRDFIQPDKPPQILIVTEKLLTEFDAPILYCLYLDKPMRDHVLLQTIARVNRPYEDAQGKAKPCRFVLDFVGIFERLEKALAFDSDEGEAKPFLLSIGERAEELAQAYEDRQLTTQQVLDAFEKLAEEVVHADAERQTLHLDENAFAIYAVLRPLLPGVKPAQAEELNAVFALFPDYAWNAEQQRNLRNALYKAVRPMVGAAKMIDITDTLLRLRRV